MCATRGCLRARLNNLGKCVVTTAQRAAASFLCVCLRSAPRAFSRCPHVWVTWHRLVSQGGDAAIQFNTSGGISYFSGQTKTAIQDLLTTDIPISLVSYTESFAWARQGKHCVKPFPITEVCVSRVPRPRAPISPSPAQHFGYSVSALVTEAQIEPAFLLQLLLLFLLKLQSWNPFYCQPEEAGLHSPRGSPL